MSSGAERRFEGPGPSEKAKEAEGSESWLQWMSNFAFTKETPTGGICDLPPQSSTLNITADASAQLGLLPPDIETARGFAAPQGELNNFPAMGCRAAGTAT